MENKMNSLGIPLINELSVNAGSSCGIGSGGFQPGNKCAKGGGGKITFDSRVDTPNGKATVVGFAKGMIDVELDVDPGNIDSYSPSQVKLIGSSVTKKAKPKVTKKAAPSTVTPAQERKWKRLTAKKGHKTYSYGNTEQSAKMKAKKLKSEGRNADYALDPMMAKLEKNSWVVFTFNAKKDAGSNCGIGSGEFQPGNKCAKSNL